MNILTKSFAIMVLLGAGIAPAWASSSSFMAVPSISSITAQVGNWIAVELQVYITKALCAPRATGTSAPSVTILDGNHMIIEAKRLPAESAPFHGLSGPRKARAHS
jgi:hypothetical protein